MLRNRKGIVLVIVIGLINVVAVLSIVALTFGLSNYYRINDRINAIKSFYFSEAGIQRALYKLKNDDFTSPETWPFAGQNININIAGPSSEWVYQISSSNTYQGVTKTIRAKAQKGTKVILLEWVQTD